MTPEEKAKELIDKFKSEIGCSDFHIPKFISGVKCADGSKEYEKVLEDETTLLAKQCAIICVDEILKELPSQIHEYNKEVELEIIYNNPRYQFWHETKQIIQNA